MIRIGVFICHCGTNIAGFLEVSAIAEHVRELPHVAFVKENLYSCSESGSSEIKNCIREQDLNRGVVAACTPRTHEPLFRKACQEAGLNPFFFEFVNIREHCSWVHMKEREEGTRKALDLIRMGVARAALLEPQEEIVAPVLPVALVIGGGLGGMTAVATLARRGFQVILVEKDKTLGGLLRGLHLLYPSGREAREVLAEMVRDIEAYPNLEVCYDPTSPPKVDQEAGTVRVYHQLLGRELTLPFDLVVLATRLVARPEAEDLSRILKVPLDADRFFLEAHVKLNPLDFAMDGIYLCGCAHWPADSAEVASQALGVAGRSSVHLARESVSVEPIVSSVWEEELCRGCGMCVALCPYRAIELVETPQGTKAPTIAVACKGCGVCGAACYVKAIKMNHYSDQQIEAQIEAFGEAAIK